MNFKKFDNNKYLLSFYQEYKINKIYIKKISKFIYH